MQSNKFDKAADSIKKCLSINPKHLPGLVAMGNLLFETQHTKQSMAYYEQALKFNAKEIYALIGLANAYYDLNEPLKAIDYY